MYISSKIIKDLRDLFAEHQKWTGILSEQLKTVQERNGKNLIKLERDGKEVNVKEEDLWKELYYGGANTQAGKVLFEKYGEIKHAQEKEEELAGELRDFTIMNLGFSFNQMSLVNLIDLIMAIRNYELKRFFLIDKFYDLFRKKKK